MKHVGNLQYTKGARKKSKRIGRGPGSGHGGTSTNGHKGQKSRSGAKIRRGFEGGQMPISRRLPKFGFTNIFKQEYQIVNVSTLQDLFESQSFENGLVNFDVLFQLGVLSKRHVPVKILGNGELSAKLNVEASKFSNSAKEKIESAGGTVVVNG